MYEESNEGYSGRTMQVTDENSTYRMVVLVGTRGILLRPKNMQRTVVRKQRHLGGHLTVVASALPEKVTTNTTNAKATCGTPLTRSKPRMLSRSHIVLE